MSATAPASGYTRTKMLRSCVLLRTALERLGWLRALLGEDEIRAIGVLRAACSVRDHAGVICAAEPQRVIEDTAEVYRLCRHARAALDGFRNSARRFRGIVPFTSREKWALRVLDQAVVRIAAFISATKGLVAVSDLPTARDLAAASLNGASQ